MVLATLIKYFLCCLDKKITPFFSTAGPIENCALCPSRYTEIILYADEGSVIDLPTSTAGENSLFYFLKCNQGLVRK